MCVSALITVNAAPVAVAGLSKVSPEYNAVTGYVAGASVAALWQLVAASVATHNGVLPDVNVTDPVAPAGSPKAETGRPEPYTIVAGAADSVSTTLSLVTVKLAPDAVEPL